MTLRRLCLMIALTTIGQSGLLTAAESIEDAMTATFRVTDKNTSGTAFLVRIDGGNSPEGRKLVLVTTAHGFQQFTGDGCWIILREKQKDDTYTRREHRLAMKDGDRLLWKKHPTEDIAVMPVELPAGIEVVPFRLEQLATADDIAARRVRVAQEAWIPGYPAQLEANPAGWPVLRRGCIASHPLAPVTAVRTFLLNASSFGGDSGAPVVVLVAPETDQLGKPASAPKPIVAGMVLGMHRQTDKVVTPFEERTHHTPLDISYAVQSHLIREAIGLLTQESK